MSRLYPQTGFIGGALPLARTPAPITGTPAQLQAGYDQAYTSALAQNQALYDNILTGYQTAAAGQRSAQEALAAGYPQLAGRVRAGLGEAAAAGQAGYDRLLGENRFISSWGGEALGNLYNRQRDIDSRYQSLQDAVMGDISRIGGAQAMTNQENYLRARGAADDDLTSRGLGNTTVRSSVMRGVEFDRARAGNELAERMAGLNAQYRSSLGLAGLSFRERAGQMQNEQERLNQRFALEANAAPQMAALAARERAAGQMAGYDAQIGMAGLNQDARNIEANTALAGRQLDWMNSVTAAYPDARAYQQAAQFAAMQAAGAGAAPTRGGYDFGGGGGMTRVPSSGGTVPSSGGYVGSGVRAPGYDFGQAFSSFTPGTGNTAGMGGGNVTSSPAWTGTGGFGAAASPTGSAGFSRSPNQYGAGQAQPGGGTGAAAGGPGFGRGGAFQGPYGRDAVADAEVQAILDQVTGGGGDPMAGWSPEDQLPADPYADVNQILPELFDTDEG